MENGDIFFSLPASVSPQLKKRGADITTQTEHETIVVDTDDDGLELGLSIQVALEMPSEIRTITSPTHSLRIKRTASMATVELAAGETSMKNGFMLLISLAEIHVPRMWVEQDDKGHFVSRVYFKWLIFMISSLGMHASILS